jgi:predicted DCC family thiol-disulfide oxidoreductase YuxK
MQADRDEANGPIVLFDGVCNLCHATVRFIIARDPDARMRFTSLQSPTGARIAAGHGVMPGALESMLLVENGMLYRKSTAALRIARLLRFPWWLGYGLIVIPRFLRDAVYDFVGRRRYRWFGTRDYCLVSQPGYERRFIE